MRSLPSATKEASTQQWRPSRAKQTKSTHVKVLWPPDAQSTHWKRPWCWGRLKAGGEEDRDEMVGWHHQLTWHEFEQTPGDGEGQDSLVCCSPRGRKESDTTEQLNNNKDREAVWRSLKVFVWQKHLPWGHTIFRNPLGWVSGRSG